MGAGDEGTCEHEGTDVHGDGGTHRNRKDNKNAEMNDGQGQMKKYERTGQKLRRVAFDDIRERNLHKNTLLFVLSFNQ